MSVVVVVVAQTTITTNGDDEILSGQSHSSAQRLRLIVFVCMWDKVVFLSLSLTHKNYDKMDIVDFAEDNSLSCPARTVTGASVCVCVLAPND